MKKYFLLSYAIVLFLATTGVIYLGFALLYPDRLNMIIICMMSLLGYTGTYIAYLGYREHLKDSE
jgi:hypothetical protein